MIVRIAILLVCCAASGLSGFHLARKHSRNVAYVDEGSILLLALNTDITIDTLKYLDRGNVSSARKLLEDDVKIRLATLQTLQPALEDASHLDDAAKAQVKEVIDRGTAYIQEHGLR